MTLELNIECRRCGLRFRQRFSDKPYDANLKCPFCSSLALALIEEPIQDKKIDREAISQADKGPSVGPKVKV